MILFHRLIFLVENNEIISSKYAAYLNNSLFVLYFNPHMHKIFSQV